MIASNPNLNPALRREAELFTDGKLTDAVLLRVATRLGLPLLSELVAQAAPDAATLAQRAVAEAEAVMRQAIHAFDVARGHLGEANRRFFLPLAKGAKPRAIPDAARLRLQSQAMSILNTRRGAKRRAEKALAAARAALLAVVS
jgi:hypothetical protein